METQPDLFSSELKIDATAKTHIRSLASWAMIVVAVTVLGYVLNIAELIMSPGSSAIEMESEGFSASVLSGQKSTGGTIFAIVIGLTINYFLFRFAGMVNSSIDGLNTEKFGKSFRNLKIYFAITSIFMMLLLLFIVIAVLALL